MMNTSKGNDPASASPISTKKEERALYASDGLECIFEKIIPEIGKSVINISMGC